MDHQPTKGAQVGYGTGGHPYRGSIVPIAASSLHPQVEYHQPLQAFWGSQMQEIEQTVDFKAHRLPLARIKKIMKADEDVKMISAETPVVFAKACEMFILELTLRSWMHTEKNKRRTLQKNDIAAAIGRTDIFDFLVDIVPKDDFKDEGGGLIIPRPLGGPTSAGAAPLPASGVVESVPPYYYVAQPPPMGSHMPPPPQQMWPKGPAPPRPPPHTTI